MSTPARPGSPRPAPSPGPSWWVPALPGDPELERSVLGAVLLLPAVAGRLLPHLHPEHFTDPRHRELLAVLGQLHQRRGAVDPATVDTEIRRRARAGTLVGNHHAVLHAALIDAPRSEHVALAAGRQLVDYAARRRIAETGLALLGAGLDPTGRLADLPARIERAVAALAPELAADLRTCTHLHPPQPAITRPRPGGRHRDDDDSELTR